MFLQNSFLQQNNVLASGIDIVQNDRFISWIDSSTRLHKVFTKRELVHFLNEFAPFENVMPQSRLRAKKTAYWAVRFAAKEAFYKALSNVLIRMEATDKTISLLYTCQEVEVIKDTWAVPTLNVGWKCIENKIDRRLPRLQTHLSLSHERTHSIASVIISL